jgi:hypothetical protein
MEQCSQSSAEEYSGSIICMADVIASATPKTSSVDTISYYSDREPNWDKRPHALQNGHILAVRRLPCDEATDHSSIVIVQSTLPEADDDSGPETQAVLYVGGTVGELCAQPVSLNGSDGEAA